jgi:broad specificity phosphatase PhoE
MGTELILIRHGNAVRVNGDYFHAPLTALGQEQAAKTGQYLNLLKTISMVFTPALYAARRKLHTLSVQKSDKTRNCDQAYRNCGGTSCLRW